MFGSHLNDDEIQQLLTPTDLSQLQRDALEDHLRGCPGCSERLRAYEQASRDLRDFRPDPIREAGHQCPPEEIWLEIASGLKRDDSGQLLGHAASCDLCGPRFRQAIEDTSDNTTGEEDRIIASLRTSQPHWQREFAGELEVSFTKPKTGRWIPGKRWMLVTSLATVLGLVCAVVFFRFSFQSSPERLLAKAYGENRTLELRIEGANPGPMMLERGSGGVDISRSPTLLEAEALISKRLREHPEDPYWLRMKGRAELLSWNYDQAVRSLNEAKGLETETPALLTDLGTAYFERAEASKNPQDYGQAVELLGTALDRDPYNATALFNHALVLERLELYSQALDDWRKYLERYPSGAWAGEAHAAEERVKLQVEQRQKGDSEPLLTPQSFAELPGGSSLEETVNSRIEDYGAIAVENWLPAAFPLKGQDNNHSNHSRQALEVISHISLERHQDHFLNDLLAFSSDSRFRSAVAHLSEAVAENHSGEQEAALVSARLSREEFHRIGSAAGELRSQFETIYAWQRTFNADQCLTSAGDLARRSGQLSYRWLAAQALIEGAFCNNEEGRIGLAAAESQAAAQLAEAAGYHDAFLRATVGQAITNWEAGSSTEGWNEVRAALREYWQGRGSRTRGTALFQVLDAIAEYESLGHLQSAVIGEYLSLLDERKDSVETFMTWFRLGDSELAIHHDEAASFAFRRAESILSSSPDGAANQDRRLLGIVGLAKVQFELGRVEDSKRLLQSVELRIGAVQESFAQMDYYRTSADLAQAMGRSDEARTAYAAAIRISEVALGSLNNPQDRMAWARSFSGAYRGLVKLDLDQGKFKEALGVWEWYRAIPIRTRISKDDLSNLQIESPGDPSGSRLVYTILDQKVGVWTVSRNEISFRWLGVESEKMGRLANEFALECADPTSDSVLLKQHSKRLYEWLIRPVETVLHTGSAVIIEPDGAIAHVPFGALSDGRDRIFADEHAIILTPGSGFDHIARHQDRISEASRFAMIESSVADPGRGQFPDHASHLEAQELLKLFHRAASLDASDLQDSRTRKILDDSEIVHYAGHFGLDAPESTADGNRRLPMRADDLYRIPFAHCQLVVLAGCSTGLAAREQWIDRDGLVLPILYADVPCVVASRWPVNSEATAVLMKHFYQGLFSGLSVSKAISTAERSIRDSPQTSHPYFWASFDVYGNCHTQS